MADLIEHFKNLLLGEVRGNTKNPKGVQKPKEKPEPNQRKKELRKPDIKELEKWWGVQKKYYKTQNEYNLYASLLAGERGILRYVQRYLGYIHYEIMNCNNLEYLRSKMVDQIIGGLTNVIHLKLSIKNGEIASIKEVVDKMVLPITKEAFFNNSIVSIKQCRNEDELNNWYKQANMTNDKLLQFTAEIEEKEINQIYWNIWNSIINRIEELIQFRQNDNGIGMDIKALKDWLEEKGKQLENALEQNGIQFEYNSQSNSEWFEVFLKADQCPAVVMKLKDEVLLVHKGKRIETEV